MLQVKLDSLYLRQRLIYMVNYGGKSDYKAPSIRQILDSSASKYGDRTFIKFIKNGSVEERSFNRLRRDSLTVCRFLRNLGKEKMHIAVAARTSYTAGSVSCSGKMKEQRNIRESNSRSGTMIEECISALPSWARTISI